MNDMPGAKNKKGKKMKPLKIAFKEDVDDDNSKIFMAFIRPDAIHIVCELKDHPDLCAIKGDGEDAYTIIEEPFLEFVARWQLALM